MKRTGISLAALAFLALPALAGVDDATWERAVKEFKTDFKKKSIGFKKRALEALPTNDERTIHFIVKSQRLLEKKDWWIRGTAAERLARINNPELRKVLHGYARAPHRTQVREGVIAALGMIKHRLDPDVIIEALKDKDWEVRRMAVMAAGRQRIKQAVETMIGMIHSVDLNGNVLQEGDDHPRVRGLVIFNLEEITGKTDFGVDVEQWKAYWERNKEKQLPPPKRFDYGTFAGVKLKFNDTFARSGRGPLVIALPQTHNTTVYYMPYFNQIKFVRWIFIDLPPMGAFPDVERDRDGDLIYPINQLVDAFEDMRKKRQVDKIALLGQGFTCWIAAKYAQKYPEHVLGLILMNPYASNQTYGKRLRELVRTGDPDDELFAKVSMKQRKIASQLEGERYGYVRDKARLKDVSDLEIVFLRNIWNDPNSETIVIPQFDIRGDATTTLPCLMFFAPKDNALGGYDDINRLRRYYRGSYVAKMKKSARLPFMEEPEKFEEYLRTFVDKKLTPRWIKEQKKAANREKKEAAKTKKED